MPALAAEPSAPRMVKAGGHTMLVDTVARELRISADVTRDASKPGVVDWGRRFQAFFGSSGGQMEQFFVFTTRVDRNSIDQGLREIGLRSFRQIRPEDTGKHTGLRPETVEQDYLSGDPILVAIRWQRDGKLVEYALEDLIQEKIVVGGKDVIKPYTPHWIYHGTAEAVANKTGCTCCPSDCNGGIIADNALPVKTTENWYKVTWDRMPPVGSKVEVVLKSIYGPAPLSSLQ
jgi:hypothetical protein